MAVNLKESLPKFTGKDEDFVWWRRRFTIWVQLANEGCSDLMLKAESDVDVSEFVGKENDRKFFGYLYLALDKVNAGLFDSFCHQSSGISLWRGVLSQYSGRDNLRKLQLRESLHTIRMGDGDYVIEYVAKLMNIVTCLR